jgi:hypothetical protein
MYRRYLLSSLYIDDNLGFSYRLNKFGLLKQFDVSDEGGQSI